MLTYSSGAVVTMQRRRLDRKATGNPTDTSSPDMWDLMPIEQAFSDMLSSVDCKATEIMEFVAGPCITIEDSLIKRNKSGS